MPPPDLWNRLKFCPTMRREQETGLEEEAFQAVSLERGEGTEWLEGGTVVEGDFWCSMFCFKM